MKKLRVTVDGKAYEVSVEILDEAESSRPSAPPPARAPVSSPPPAAAPAPSAAAPAAASAAPGDVICPLAGKVVSIDVTVGQAVKAGDQLATIEAMKMNTFVFSDADGKVTAIHAAPGGSIEEGAPLLRLA